MLEKEAIAVLVKAYVEKNFAYDLLYPSIIVRVLPKPDQFGMLFIPDQYRNKPVYEGVVMQTWQKRTVVSRGKELHLTPTFKQGDLVLFPHWAGQPVPTFDDDKGVEWRILTDKSVFNKPGVLDDPSPFCLIDTNSENPQKKMIALLTDHLNTVSPKLDVVNALFKEFDITIKHKQSVLNYMEPTRPD